MTKLIAENRRARYDYFIEETFEAGIMLTGTEVKSLRVGRANIAESYASVEGREIKLINADIPPYGHAGPHFNHEPRRHRKLLLQSQADRQADRRRPARRPHDDPAQALLEREGPGQAGDRAWPRARRTTTSARPKPRATGSATRRA
jgi:hypothetical protein